METHLQSVFADYDSPRILVLGCGNSKLSELIYNNGHADVTNIDFSAVVISDMKKRYATYEGMLCAFTRLFWGNRCCWWLTYTAAGGCPGYVCNAMDLSLFPENSFDIVIDKGVAACGAAGDFVGEPASTYARWRVWPPFRLFGLPVFDAYWSSKRNQRMQGVCFMCGRGCRSC